MKANVPMGTLLSMIGLRMKISRRKEVNQIAEEVPDALLFEILRRKPMNLKNFLKVRGSKKAIWHYFGDLIVKSLEGGFYAMTFTVFGF